MTILTHKDYKKILKYYKIKIPRSKKETRKKAVKIMGTKLCRCIKKVKKRGQKFTRKRKNPETAICTSSIFTKRGLKHGRFTCKKKYKLYINRKTGKYLNKTRRNFTMKYK
tara:strand:- start:125 stop:457 length:333 start_codon:yes stop_codon:yes gene_type:complete